MTEWLVRTFVKNHEETHRSDVRFSYARLSGIVGILCNLVLFAVKLMTGVVSGSAAITSDAANNLTDCISCIVQLAGNRFAARPADNEHPFGHGRVEYLVSLTAAAMIFSAAFELFVHGVREIISPTPLSFSPFMAFVLAVTILVKIWMSRFNETLGNRLDHSGMKAAAMDSRNDVIATSLTLLSSILGMRFPSIPFDGMMGAAVALYIGFGGYSLAKEIIGKLIGDETDEELKQQIRDNVLSNQGVLGIHDLIIHDYGAGHKMGSVHAELNGDLSLREAHAIIDACEQRVEAQQHVKLTVHPDPIDTDEKTTQWKEKTRQAIEAIVPGSSVHDFHVIAEDDEILLRFDAALPFECRYGSAEILKRLEAALSDSGKPVHCDITFDRGYFSERGQ